MCRGEEKYSLEEVGWFWENVKVRGKKGEWKGTEGRIEEKEKGNGKAKRKG